MASLLSLSLWAVSTPMLCLFFVSGKSRRCYLPFDSHALLYKVDYPNPARLLSVLPYTFGRTCSPNSLLPLLIFRRSHVVAVPIFPFNVHICKTPTPKTLQAGADAVDAAMDAMAGTTSQPSMGALASSLARSPLDTGLDMDEITKVSSNSFTSSFCRSLQLFQQLMQQQL